jgi:Protein of unknown function (DUF3999)
MKYALIILFIYAVNVTAVENEPSMHEYAKGIELVTEQQSAIYKLALPEEVYKTVTRKDLSDIRVFNQDHEPVPHIVRQSKTKIVTESGAINLPYFPLPVDDVSQADNALDITVSSEGKVVRIQSESGTSDLNQENIKHYLIDASHIEAPIDSIDFKLKGNESYAKAFRLEYSNNLNQWSTLVSRSTLTELEYGNYSLKNTRVNLPNKKIKYLRFTWLDDIDGLTIASVKANFRAQFLFGQQYWSTSRLVNKNIEEASYEFDTGGMFNIEEINIELPEDNILIDVILESRFNENSNWRRRFSGIFYKLYFEDMELTSKPATINVTKDRYWRIKLQSTDGIGQIEPVLKYAWRSNDLYFLARGKSPYVLAFGNANNNVTSHASSKLMNIVNEDFNSKMVGIANAGGEVILKGDAALTLQKTLPWQRIMLWAILVIGVLMIATMVVSLAKNMSKIGADKQ